MKIAESQDKLAFLTCLESLPLRLIFSYLYRILDLFNNCVAEQVYSL